MPADHRCMSLLVAGKECGCRDGRVAAACRRERETWIRDQRGIEERERRAMKCGRGSEREMTEWMSVRESAGFPIDRRFKSRYFLISSLFSDVVIASSGAAGILSLTPRCCCERRVTHDKRSFRYSVAADPAASGTRDFVSDLTLEQQQRQCQGLKGA